MKDSTKIILSGIIGLLVGALSVWLYKRYIETEKYEGENKFQLAQDSSSATFADLYSKAGDINPDVVVLGSEKTNKPSIFTSFGALGFIAKGDVIVADLSLTEQEDQAHYTQAGYYLSQKQRDELSAICNAKENRDDRYTCLRNILTRWGSQNGSL